MMRKHILLSSRMQNRLHAKPNQAHHPSSLIGFVTDARGSRMLSIRPGAFELRWRIYKAPGAAKVDAKDSSTSHAVISGDP